MQGGFWNSERTSPACWAVIILLWGWGESKKKLHTLRAFCLQVLLQGILWYFNEDLFGL